jgi:anti-anti-sigma factor
MALTKTSPSADSPSNPIRITATGDLLASTVEQERARLLGLLQDISAPVVLDISKVTEIDSLGITLVLGVFKHCHKMGLAFAIEGVSPEIMRVFRLFSLPKLFAVKEV